MKCILYICAIALLLENVSGAYVDQSYDCIPPWARTFLARRRANTNIAGNRSSPLLKNIPRLYSAVPAALEGALPTLGSGSVSCGCAWPNDDLLFAKAALLGYNRIGSLGYNEFDRFGYY